MKQRMSQNDGFALVTVLIFSVFLTMIGLSIVVLSTTEVMISSNNMLEKKAFFAAEGGLENMIADLAQITANQSIPTPQQLLSISEVPPDFDGYSFPEYGISRDGSAYLQTITVGPYSGLYAIVQPYRMVSSAAGPQSASVRVERASEHHLIPIFQFGIFYEEDLEVFPGPEMTIGGRVHSNKSMYLGSNTDLYMDGVVTAAGSIYNTRKDEGAQPPGDVKIKDDRGTYKKLLFDSTDPNWEDKALRTWGGRVQDQAHGILKIGLPLPENVQPIEIIKRGELGDSEILREARFYYLAGLKIVDGVATDQEDNPVEIHEHVLSTQTFYNFRESKWLTATQIDVDQLIYHGNVPDNGVIYISSSETAPGARDAVIRLVNGSQLPAGGLTVATDNPMYIWGDYNVIDPQPASVLGDAFSALSNLWDDANSDKDISYRQASQTAIRVGIIAGTIPTGVGSYNGGIENFPRFLEDWGGRDMTYIGSLICMWDCEWATGSWIYGAPYYTSPNRVWSLDPAFADPDLMPPGTPSIINFEPGEWSYE